jgi:hypothetical protein
LANVPGQEVVAGELSKVVCFSLDEVDENLSSARHPRYISFFASYRAYYTHI